MSSLHHVQATPQRIDRYESPTDLHDALVLLDRLGPRARLVAGGTDLMVELDRAARPGVDTLIDLSRIPSLRSIDLDEGRLTLGAAVTHNQVLSSARCVEDALPLAQACLEIGSPQLRNRATVAGNVVTASPANDTISALLALDAAVEIASVHGRRTLPVGAFVTGFRETALEPGEMVTGLSMPVLTPTQRGVFVKLGLRRAQAISVVHLAAVIDLDGDVVTRARIAVGSVAPVVLTIKGFDEVLAGRPLDTAAIDDAVRVVGDAVSPIDDLRASAGYRRETVEVMVRRALLSLVDGDGRATWPHAPPLLDSGRAAAHDTPVHVDRGAVIAATVNGSAVEAPARAQTLLDWIRDDVGLKGTKEGCAEGECGACTVHLDGRAVMSCLVPAGRAAGSDVVTVEGLTADGEPLHPVQQAFVDAGAAQCGFCTPGFIMSAAVLLAEVPDPTPEQIRAALAGNLCRCTGYYAITDAIERAITR